MSDEITFSRAVNAANRVLDNAEESIEHNSSSGPLFIYQAFHFIMRATRAMGPTDNEQDLRELHTRRRRLTKLLPRRERMWIFFDLISIRQSYKIGRL